MIPRYSRPEMVALWEPATKFRIWFEIEAHACDAQAALGVIPQGQCRGRLEGARTWNSTWPASTRSRR
jgi:adenylosuccinate lyase